MRGELSFTDVVDAEPFYYPYWGNIQLGRRRIGRATVGVDPAAWPGRPPRRGRVAVTAPC